MKTFFCDYKCNECLKRIRTETTHKPKESVKWHRCPHPICPKELRSRGRYFEFINEPGNPYVKLILHDGDYRRGLYKKRENFQLVGTMQDLVLAREMERENYEYECDTD